LAVGGVGGSVVADMDLQGIEQIALELSWHLIPVNGRGGQGVEQAGVTGGVGSLVQFAKSSHLRGAFPFEGVHPVTDAVEESTGGVITGFQGGDQPVLTLADLRDRALQRCTARRMLAAALGGLMPGFRRQ
jgi:hypothetical protein